MKWVISQETDNGNVYIVTDDAEMDSVCLTDREHAALIAAAPELLETLESFVEYCEAIQKGGRTFFNWKKVKDNIESIIARAKGDA